MSQLRKSSLTPSQVFVFATILTKFVDFGFGTAEVTFASVISIIAKAPRANCPHKNFEDCGAIVFNDASQEVERRLAGFVLVDRCPEQRLEVRVGAIL